MSSLKHNDDYKGFYTKFKEMYGEICDSDWFKKSIFSLFEKLFIVQYCNVNYFFEFLIENTYLLKIDWNPKGTYNLIACYVSLKFSWNSGYQKLFIVKYCNVNYFFEFLIENTYLLKIDWNPKGTYNLIACYVSLKFSWNSGYQKLFIVKYDNLNYFSAFSIIFYILKQNQMFFAKYQKS